MSSRKQRKTVSRSGLRVFDMPSSLRIGVGLIRFKHAVANVGNNGVLISRTRVGYCRLRRNMRVIVIRHSFFVETESGFGRMASNPLSQGSAVLRNSRPPASTVALIRTTAVNLPSGALSCNRDVILVFNLWTRRPWLFALLEPIDGEACKRSELLEIEEARKCAMLGSCLTGVETSRWAIGRSGLNVAMLRI